MEKTLTKYLSMEVLIWNKYLTVLWPVNITMAHQHCQGIRGRLNT